jgi:hypothetical protein
MRGFARRSSQAVYPSLGTAMTEEPKTTELRCDSGPHSDRYVFPLRSFAVLIGIHARSFAQDFDSQRNGCENTDAQKGPICVPPLITN